LALSAETLEEGEAERDARREWLARKTEWEIVVVSLDGPGIRIGELELGAILRGKRVGQPGKKIVEEQAILNGTLGL
jgi:hypothetical protein